VTYRIQWETLEDKEMKKRFASSMTANFKQLSGKSVQSEDIEKKWPLFRSAIFASAVECCGQKRLRVAKDSENRTL